MAVMMATFMAALVPRASVCADRIQEVLDTPSSVVLSATPTTVLPERGDAPLYHSRRGGFEVGFYRVVGRRSRAAPRPGN